MLCPNCEDKEKKTGVVNSRRDEAGSLVRRRRECKVCGHRFTTTESVDTQFKKVDKSSGFSQGFDLNKLRLSIEQAFDGQVINKQQVTDLVMLVQRKLSNHPRPSIKSQQIAEWIMHSLKNTNEIAYARYAAEYREFYEAGPRKTKQQRLLDIQIDMFTTKKD